MTAPGSQPLKNPTGTHLDERAVIFCVTAAGFAYQFEAFVVGASLPSIARDLGVTVSESSLILLTYLISATLALLPSGQLAERHGLARVFVFGAVQMAVGTLLSGLSVGLWTLLAARLVQGLGAGAMVAAGYASIPAFLPPDRVGRAFSALATGAGLGMVSGLPVGGLLTHGAHWRAIFLVTVPPMVALAMMAHRKLPRGNRAGRSSGGSPDILAVCLFAAVVVFGVLGMSQGSELGWRSPSILGLLGIAGLLAGGLGVRLGRSHGHRERIRSLIRSGFVYALAVLFLFQAAVGGIRFLLPFHLESQLGLSSFNASLILMTFPVGMILAARFLGGLSDRWGTTLPVAGSCLVGAGASLILAFQPLGPQALLAGIPLLLLGGALGTFSPANNRRTALAVPPDGQAAVTAFLPIALNLGVVFGVSLLETIFSLGFPGGAAGLKGHPDPDTFLLMTRGFREAFVAGGVMLLAAAGGSVALGRKTLARDGRDLAPGPLPPSVDRMDA